MRGWRHNGKKGPRNARSRTCCKRTSPRGPRGGGKNGAQEAGLRGPRGEHGEQMAESMAGKQGRPPCTGLGAGGKTREMKECRITKDNHGRAESEGEITLSGCLRACLSKGILSLILPIFPYHHLTHHSYIIDHVSYIPSISRSVCGKQGYLGVIQHVRKTIT